MQNDDEQSNVEMVQQLKATNAQLAKINANMLKVFWIVAIFALLYFGLMIYMLFFRIWNLKNNTLQANIYMACRAVYFKVYYSSVKSLQL